MKYISIVISFVLVLVLTLSLTSAIVIPNQKFHLPIGNLGLSSDLTFEKVVQLCTQESCVIDNEARTITVLSHYNNKVALTFSEFFNGNVQMDIRIPYDTAENDTANEPYKTPIIRDINPADYNWAESIRVDLTYLKDSEILDISDEDITNIIETYNKGDSGTGGTSGDWNYFCNMIYKKLAGDTQIGCPADVNIQEPSPILPQKEFILEKIPKSSNWIYYLGGVIILALILYFVFRRKK